MSTHSKSPLKSELTPDHILYGQLPAVSIADPSDLELLKHALKYIRRGITFRIDPDWDAYWEQRGRYSQSQIAALQIKINNVERNKTPAPDKFKYCVFALAFPPVLRLHASAGPGTKCADCGKRLKIGDQYIYEPELNSSSETEGATVCTRCELGEEWAQRLADDEACRQFLVDFYNIYQA